MSTESPGAGATPTGTAAAASPGLPVPPASIPWLGLIAVLLGTFISTVNTRLSSLGLADIRGAVHAGFDEGAWISTAQTVAQMLIAPIAVWTGGIFGPRRMLLEAAAAFAVVSFLEPFSPNLQTLLALQFVGGLASGFFVPLTLSFILRNLPPKVWAYGIALYALNLEISLNISASLEGWYVDHLSWRWIFWQNVPLAVGMAACLRFGIAPEPVNPQRPPPDLYGFAAGGLGLALVYAALDQGNRLDWTNSPLVWALMLSGCVLLVGFFVHETHTPHPGVNLKVILEAPLPRLLLLIAFLRLTILSTAYVIPQFLQTVRGFRALEVGQTLVWIAVPQLAICLLAGYILRRADPRIVASCGFLCISAACLMVAHGLTPLWGSDQFLPSQILQAVGQSFALSGTIFFAVLHLRPQDALTFGAGTQIARLMGGEIGQAFIATFLRVRGQIASNLLGQHVQIGDGRVIQRVQAYGAATARAGDPSSATTRGAAVLNNIVHGAAITQGVIDAFVVIAALTALTLMIVVTRRAAPPGPASHVSIFARRGAPTQ
ncbi:MAG TPA: MFS transporter [Steroidobacteraceae bacterium]|nr:MFS transporter [Steroidobacteraceae bacterium]